MLQFQPQEHLLHSYIVASQSEQARDRLSLDLAAAMLCRSDGVRPCRTCRDCRKVYDGGGVMPDIATDPEYISRFALTLYALGFIEDFGDEHTRRNPGRQIDIRTFSITDKDYADFAEFMQDKKVPYESDTRRALKALKKAAEDDRFADLKNKFEQVEAELKDDTQTNLETYRTQVVETINNDIVMRHGYQAGVIEHSLSGDKEVKKAVEVLGDPAEYARITREQDTKRK